MNGPGETGRGPRPGRGRRLGRGRPLLALVAASIAASVVLVAAALATIVAGPAGATGAGMAGGGPINQTYVALGDSFAAGPLLPDQVALDPCLRSDHDYAHLVAEALSVRTFRDVTCSSATTANVLTTPQPPYLPWDPSVPPQIDAVTPDTTLVTITIGANDADLTGLATKCINLLPPPFGTSCEATDTAGGVDRGAQAVDAAAVNVGAVIDAVHQRAPHARVLVTSYGDYLPPGGCYPLVPAWPQDANYIQGLIDRLGRDTATVAAARHAAYVDFITPGSADTACQPVVNWVTGIFPTGTGVTPLHPTLLGEANFARIIVADLAGAVP